MHPVSLDIPSARLADFCRRWQITELSLFGSVLRDDFGPASDVDVLVTFGPGAAPSLLRMEQARRELEALLGRKVDLLSRRAVEQHRNPWLRDEVLGSARRVFAA